jgi:hypothetical protein
MLYIASNWKATIHIYSLKKFPKIQKFIAFTIGRWPDMGTPSQNSVIFEKYFFGLKKILKNYKNWMVL